MQFAFCPSCRHEFGQVRPEGMGTEVVEVEEHGPCGVVGFLTKCP